MPDRSVFAVFLHQQAIEALGVAIKPYLADSPAGPHLQCVEIDHGGALVEMLLIGRNAEGHTMEVELMVPVGMIKLVISVKREDDFGFGQRESGEAPSVAESGVGPAPSTVAPGAAAT